MPCRLRALDLVAKKAATRHLSVVFVLVTRLETPRLSARFSSAGLRLNRTIRCLRQRIWYCHASSGSTVSNRTIATPALVLFTFMGQNMRTKSENPKATDVHDC